MKKNNKRNFYGNGYVIPGSVLDHFYIRRKRFIDQISFDGKLLNRFSFRPVLSLYFDFFTRNNLRFVTGSKNYFFSRNSIYKICNEKRKIITIFSFNKRKFYPLRCFYYNKKIFFGNYKPYPSSGSSIYELEIETSKLKKVKTLFDIKHIHNIIFNSHNNSYIVSTGDKDNESSIRFLDLNFNQISIIKGNQIYRTIDLFPIFDEPRIIYGTDIEKGPNYIVKYNRKSDSLSKVFSYSNSPIFQSFFDINKGLICAEAIEPNIEDKPRKISIYLYNAKTNNEIISRGNFLNNAFCMRLFQYPQFQFSIISNKKDSSLIIIYTLHSFPRFHRTLGYKMCY